MKLLKNPVAQDPVAQAILPVQCGAAAQERAWERVSSLQEHLCESLRPGARPWFLLAPRHRGGRSGLTLIELIVAFTILLILSTMALPLARVRVQREKERRLRDALTEMRKAIDRYKDYADAGKLGQIDPDSFGYPESLEMLVEGVEISDTGGANPLGGMQGAGGFGQPAGRNSRSNRSGSGSSRGFGSSGSGFGSSGGGFGSSRGGFGSSSGGFGQSNRGSSSSRGGFGSAREGQGGSNAFGEPGRPGSDEEEKKIRFLRRIPVDPISGSADWGLRSVKDPPESMSWGGSNVFDVYSKSMDTALDGTRYSEW